MREPRTHNILKKDPEKDWIKCNQTMVLTNVVSYGAGLSSRKTLGNDFFSVLQDSESFELRTPFKLELKKVALSLKMFVGLGLPYLKIMKQESENMAMSALIPGISPYCDTEKTESDIWEYIWFHGIRDNDILLPTFIGTSLLLLLLLLLSTFTTHKKRRKKQVNKILMKIQICKMLSNRCFDCVLLLLSIGPLKWTSLDKVKMKGLRSRNQKKKSWTRELPRLHKNTATMTTKKCISSRRKQILLQGKTHWLLSSFNIVTCVILLHSCCGIVEAVFAPADLDVLKAGWAECKSENGGTGDCVIFASKNDTSGTGTKNGLIRSWNVSRVTSMRECECLLLIYVVVSLWKRKRKTLSFILLFTNVSYI